MHSENTTTSINYQSAFLASMWLAPVFTKQELTSVGTPSNNRHSQGNLPLYDEYHKAATYLSAVSKHNETKKSTFQSPNDDKIHFYLCFLPVSATTLQVSSDLWSWANGPIRVDLGVTWLAKWRGIPGRQGERMRWEGLAHFNVMQNRDNLYFPRATHWIKNTFNVIL